MLQQETVPNETSVANLGDILMHIAILTVRRNRLVLRAKNLDHFDFLVLELIRFSPPMTATAIGRTFNMKISAQTAVVGKLTTGGYVIAEETSEDWRERPLSLTPKGQAELTAYKDWNKECVVDDFLRRIPLDQLVAVQAGLAAGVARAFDRALNPMF